MVGMAASAYLYFSMTFIPNLCCLVKLHLTIKYDNQDAICKDNFNPVILPPGLTRQQPCLVYSTSVINPLKWIQWKSWEFPLDL